MSEHEETAKRLPEELHKRMMALRLEVIGSIVDDIESAIAAALAEAEAKAWDEGSRSGHDARYPALEAEIARLKAEVERLERRLTRATWVSSTCVYLNDGTKVVVERGNGSKGPTLKIVPQDRIGLASVDQYQQDELSQLRADRDAAEARGRREGLWWAKNNWRVRWSDFRDDIDAEIAKAGGEHA